MTHFTIIVYFLGTLSGMILHHFSTPSCQKVDILMVFMWKNSSVQWNLIPVPHGIWDVLFRLGQYGFKTSDPPRKHYNMKLTYSTTFYISMWKWEHYSILTVACQAIKRILDQVPGKVVSEKKLRKVWLRKNFILYFNTGCKWTQKTGWLEVISNSWLKIFHSFWYPGKTKSRIEYPFDVCKPNFPYIWKHNLY